MLSSQTKKIDMDKIKRFITNKNAIKIDKERFNTILKLSSKNLKIAVVLSFVIMFVSMFFMTNTLKSFFELKNQQAQIDSQIFVMPEIKTNPVPPEIMQRIVSRYSGLIMGINVTHENGVKVTVTGNDLAKFNEWQNTILALKSTDPKWRWTLQEICIGDGCVNPLYIVMNVNIVTVQ